MILKRKAMKELLQCTKHVHFTFNGDIRIQLDSVAMGSVLGFLLPNVFLCSFKESIVPTLKNSFVHWKDTSVIHMGISTQEKTDYVLRNLNSFCK